MFSDKTIAQHPLVKILQEVLSIQIELAEARKQESDWNKLIVQHENDLNVAKRKARELSDVLFGEKVNTEISTSSISDLDISGVVKWWNSEKGYGFIEVSKGDDVFAHFQDLVMEGFKNLDEGDKVLFNIAQGSRGRTAMNIRKISQ